MHRAYAQAAVGACLLLVLASCGQAQKAPAPANGIADGIADGVYEVLAAEERREDLPTPGADTHVLVFDREFIEGGSETPPLHVLLRITGFAPLDLQEPPRVAEAGGRRVLNLSLRAAAAEALNQLTSRAERAAVVVGDSIVTVHRIRIAIEGGRLQVSC